MAVQIGGDIRTTILAALLLCSISSTAADGYICVTEVATGVAYDENRKAWRSTHFTNRPTYIFRKLKKDEKVRYRLSATELPWGVFETGESYPKAYCEDFGIGTVLDCGRFIEKFRMSKETLRFIGYYMFGYVDGVDNNDNTPAILIGKCSPL